MKHATFLPILVFLVLFLGCRLAVYKDGGAEQVAVICI